MHRRRGRIVMTAIAMALTAYYYVIGYVLIGANWPDAVLSVSPALAVMTNTSNEWTGNQWSNIGICQTGGHLEDLHTDYDRYTNLGVSGIFKTRDNTTGSVFRQLCGRVKAAWFDPNSSLQIEVKTVVFLAGALTSRTPVAKLMLLAAESSARGIDDWTGYGLLSFCEDFKNGTTGSFTLGQNFGGAIPTYQAPRRG